jgi:hypothetical protein
VLKEVRDYSQKLARVIGSLGVIYLKDPVMVERTTYVQEADVGE